MTWVNWNAADIDSNEYVMPNTLCAMAGIIVLSLLSNAVSVSASNKEIYISILNQNYWKLNHRPCASDFFTSMIKKSSIQVCKYLFTCVTYYRYINPAMQSDLAYVLSICRNTLFSQIDDWFYTVKINLLLVYWGRFYDSDFSETSMALQLPDVHFVCSIWRQVLKLHSAWSVEH